MKDKKRFEQNQIFNTKYLIRDVFDLATLKELHEDIQAANLNIVANPLQPIEVRQAT